MVRAGADRVKRFNWYRVARGVLSVYHEVHKRTDSQPLTVQSFIPRTIWSKLRQIETLKNAVLDENRIRGLLTVKEPQP
jgi:hypothetical protein